MERAAGVLAPAAARAEAARVTNRGPAREAPPTGFSPMGRLFSYRAPAREFPQRCGRALARESPLEGSARITKSWESTRSRPGNIWNEAQCPRAIRTWCAATLRSWSSKPIPQWYPLKGIFHCRRGPHIPGKVGWSRLSMDGSITLDPGSVLEVTHFRSARMDQSQGETAVGEQDVAEFIDTARPFGGGDWPCHRGPTTGSAGCHHRPLIGGARPA